MVKYTKPYNIIITKQAYKDAKNIASSGLKSKVDSLIKIIEDDPFAYPPPYEN